MRGEACGGLRCADLKWRLDYDETGIRQRLPKPHRWARLRMTCNIYIVNIFITKLPQHYSSFPGGSVLQILSDVLLVSTFPKTPLKGTFSLH